MKADKYLYDEEVEIIYELDKHEIYNPIIFVKSEEKDCSDSIDARSRLDYLKEFKLEMYVELCEKDSLKEYIEKYLNSLFDTYKLILSQMETQTAMDKMIAMDMARNDCI